MQLRPDHWLEGWRSAPSFLCLTPEYGASILLWPTHNSGRQDEPGSVSPVGGCLQCNYFPLISLYFSISWVQIPFSTLIPMESQCWWYLVWDPERIMYKPKRKLFFGKKISTSHREYRQLSIVNCPMTVNYRRGGYTSLVLMKKKRNNKKDNPDPPL